MVWLGGSGVLWSLSKSSKNIRSMFWGGWVTVPQAGGGKLTKYPEVLRGGWRQGTGAHLTWPLGLKSLRAGPQPATSTVHGAAGGSQQLQERGELPRVCGSWSGCINEPDPPAEPFSQGKSHATESHATDMPWRDAIIEDSPLPMEISFNSFWFWEWVIREVILGHIVPCPQHF